MTDTTLSDLVQYAAVEESDYKDGRHQVNETLFAEWHAEVSQEYKKELNEHYCASRDLHNVI